MPGTSSRLAHRSSSFNGHPSTPTTCKPFSSAAHAAPHGRSSPDLARRSNPPCLTRCPTRIRSVAPPTWPLKPYRTDTSEQIRNKRLAKLGGQSSAPASPAPGDSNSASGAASPSASTPQPANAPSPIPATALSPSPSSTPAAVTESQAPAPKISITKKAPTSLPQKRDNENESRPRPRPAATPENFETWQHRILSNIFRVSLDEAYAQDAHGNRLTYVPGVKGDLEDAGSPLLLNTTVLEGVLFEGASNRPDGKPLNWLLSCWKRATRVSRGATTADKSDPARAEVMKEARRLTLNYTMLAVNVPDMFGLDAWPVNPLAQHMLNDPEDEHGICHDFLNEAVSRFEEDESIKDALVGAVEQLSQDLSKKSMNDQFKPYMMVCDNFLCLNRDR